MNTKRITGSVLAATIATVGVFALAPSAGATADTPTCSSTESWPASAEGRPAARPDAEGVYLWHTTTGWRLRVNDPGPDRAVFTGSVRVDGQIVAIGRRLEPGAEGVVTRTGAGAAYFRFVNYGGVDGINFATRCSTNLRVNVKRNGVTVPAAHVYIGAAGTNPDAVPFTITKTA